MIGRTNSTSSSGTTPVIDWGELYPVGRIITWYDNDDHSNFLGLTWERCLLGASR